MELGDGEGSWPTECRHNRHNELQLTAGRKHTSSFERLLRGVAAAQYGSDGERTLAPFSMIRFLRVVVLLSFRSL